MTERTVLHVLPHPGPGGEGYVNLLEGMEGYRFERYFLSDERSPTQALARAQRARIRARGSDLVHLHGDATAILAAGLLRTHPGLINFHGLHLTRRSHGLRGALLRARLRRSVSLSRGAICSSSSEFEEATALVGPLLEPRLLPIESGIELPPPIDGERRRRTREELGLAEDEVAVIYAAQLEARKAPLDLMAALERVNQRGLPVVGLILGAGPQEAQIRERAEAANARVLGHRDDLERMLEAADVFALPSQREGLSLSLLQAMGTGLPVIVSDGPGNPETVGDTGEVVPFGEVEALAEAIAKLVGDAGLRSSLGSAARERVASLYAVDRMVEEVQAAYDHAIGVSAETPERTVLQILPHPGGGGERYVEMLEEMPGFRSERMMLTERRGRVQAVIRSARARRATRKADLVHVHGDAAAILCRGALGARPSVITLHGVNLLRRSGGVRRMLVARALNQAMERADVSICVSDSERSDIETIASRSAHLQVVRNGVPLQAALDGPARAEARSQLEIGDDSIVVLYAGQLEPHKDPITFARAMRIAAKVEPRLVGLLAGEGTLRPELLRDGGGTIRLLGHREELTPLLAAADIFVSTSRREGLSLVVLEAMSLGVPLIVSDVPGNLEAVGDAGLIFPVGEPKALADAVTRLVADAELRSEIGERGRRRVESGFDAREMVSQVRAVYEVALERSGA